MTGWTLERATRNPVAAAGLFAVAFGAAAMIGHFPAGVELTPAAVVAPTGVVLAALLVSPAGRWGGVLALAVAIQLAFSLSRGEAGAGVVLALAVLAAAQLAFNAWWFRRWAGAEPGLGRVATVLKFTATIAGANALGALPAALVLAGSGGYDVKEYAVARWAGHTLTELIVTTLILAWWRVDARGLGTKAGRAVEALALAAVTAVVARVALSAPDGWAPILPAPFLTLLPVLGLALRFGQPGATLAVAVVGGFAALQASGTGAWPPSEDLLARWLKAELFLGVLALAGLLFGAGLEEKAALGEESRRSERKFRAMFEASPTPACVVQDGRVTLTNPGFARLFPAGGGAEARRLEELVAKEDFPRVAEAMVRVAAGGAEAAEPFEVRGRRGAADAFPLELRFERFEAGTERFLLVLAVDLTERRRVERELQRIDRALRALSRCAQTVAHAVDEERLLRSVCDVLVREGGYPLVWVGYADHDEARRVRPRAQAGAQTGYLAGLEISWADVPDGHGPTGTAIRTGTSQTSRNFRMDPRMSDGRERAQRHGIGSSLAVPLRVNGEVIGVVSIHAGEAEAFDAKEVELLEQMVADLAFGIETLRARLERERAEQEVRRLLAEAERVRMTLLSILEDRKRAEEALERSEERYRSAMQQSAIGMAIVAPDGRWLEVNPALCAIVGYTREEMLERTYAMVTHPEDRGPDQVLVQDVLEGKAERLSLDKRYLHKSGRVVWVQIQSKLVRDAQGRPLHFVTQTQDITARKEAETALAETTARLTLALRASKLGVWRLHLATGRCECDERTRAMFGIREKEAADGSEALPVAVVPEDRPRLQEAWQSLRTGAGVFRLRVRVPAAGRAERHIELQGLVHDDRSGRREWAIGVAHDLTEIVEATAESEQLKAQLQQAQKMESLGNLAAGVAHDFNNLLTGINGFVELASLSLGPSHEAAELLKQAQRGAKSARDLVRRILDFSRSTGVAPRAAINVVAVVRDTAPLLVAAMPGRVSLGVAASCDEAPVLGDSGQIQQVLMNLCTNAAHAIGGRPGTVKITIDRCELGAPGRVPPPGCVAGRYVRLAVIDDGCGMDAATRDRIWEKFFTTKRAGEGTGLGLPIVRDIVTAHEGGIEVTSVPGKGTTFALYFPLAGSVAESRPPREPGRPEASGGERIMIIDDEPSIGMLTRLSLARQGFRPESYLSPLDAWARFQAAPREFDLLIVDQNMPGLTGTELLQRVRSLVPELPAIVMSGRFEQITEWELLQAQAVHPLRKPFEIADLVAAVTSALASGRRLKAGPDLPGSRSG